MSAETCGTEGLAGDIIIHPVYYGLLLSVLCPLTHCYTTCHYIMYCMVMKDTMCRANEAFPFEIQKVP